MSKMKDLKKEKEYKRSSDWIEPETRGAFMEHQPQPNHPKAPHNNPNVKSPVKKPVLSKGGKK